MLPMRVLASPQVKTVSNTPLFIPKKCNCPLPEKNHYTQEKYYGISVYEEIKGIDEIVNNIKNLKKKHPNVKIILADTLMRHYLTNATTSAKEAHEKAREIGLKWEKAIIERWNQEYPCIKDDISNTFVKWDTWISTESYEKCKRKIDSLYKYDTHFKQEIDQIISMFIERKTKKSDLSIMMYTKEQLIAYILEEFATMLLITNTACQIFFYNGCVRIFTDLIAKFSQKQVRFVKITRYRKAVDHA